MTLGRKRGGVTLGFKRLASKPPTFAKVDEALDEIRRGRFVVVTTGLDPNSTGGLVVAAQHANTEALDFIREEGPGQWYLCLSDERCDELQLEPEGPMTDDPASRFVSVMGTLSHPGADPSLASKAETVQIAIDPAKGPGDLIRPGFVNVLRGRPAGVLQHASSADAAVDLARLAGLLPAGVLSTVGGKNGPVMRGRDLVAYANRKGLKAVAMNDLISYRRSTDKLVDRSASVRLPTEYGDFTAIAFTEKLTGVNHLAVVKGAVAGAENVLVRIQSDCFYGDVFGSTKCQCGTYLRESLGRIEKEGRGVLVYMTNHRDEPGTGDHQADSDQLTDHAHEYGISAQILADLGLTTIKTLTNRTDYSPDPATLEGFGLRIVERILITAPK